ncbi:GAF and ANTAR domain-containing protein [Geodermatophilus sp. DSM 45219]|uniref:GAF and ANTAR domain-containing protein n=1 Tax=Geodermatophilus sp. DSM 45219 TaxID=1881103 RepID=UPI00088B5394|nr:GAF and ANTAR domain-containing protein [Geodermatophilus sp. DSM 45219]SDO71701.1 GAF domain-containing protein [Geodermatophilus sp. DSM 45219]
MSSDDQSSAGGAGEALERLGRLTLREMSMQSLLQAVADTAKSVMPGNPEASILIMTSRRSVTVVSTGQLATDLDEVQYGQGQGPCLHAAASGELTEILDTRIEDRWADYARRAAGRGNLSSLSVPLVIDDGTTGALNIYAREARAFDDESRSTATGFAPYAAVAIGNMQEYEGAQKMVGNLQAALDSRAVIDQAKGILMERHKITADQAFQLLAHASMTTNTKVRDVADHLVHTGELRAPKR